MNPGWSYILTAIGVFGLWLAGRKDWRGWLVGLSAQGVWLAYAVADRQSHGEFSGYAEVLWPCPTIRALGDEQS